MPYFHHFLAESTMSTMNNKCCNSSAFTPGNNNGSVIKTVKTGYLLHFKKRLFGKAWREEFVVLYEDSSLIWFRDRDRNDPEGGIFLKDAPEMLAAGQWTSRVPSHPEFPHGCTFHHSIAIGSRHRRDKVHWFLCKSDSELIDWMSAISHTLPPVPPPPEELRNSRRNLAKLEPSLTPPLTRQQPMASSSAEALLTTNTHPSIVDKRLALLKHQPSSPDVLLAKLERIKIEEQEANNAVAASAAMAASSRNHAPYLSEKSRSYSTGKMHHISSTAAMAAAAAAAAAEKPRVTFREDVMAGVMMAGALSQWNAATSTATSFFGPGLFGASAGGAATIGMSSGVPWDWGMGWGWAGWTPADAVGSATSAGAFCGSCALEQHHASSAAAMASSNTDIASNMQRHEFFYDDDHELGELGEATDVGCDFGDFGGF